MTRPVRVVLTGEASEEYDRLDKITKEEQAKGIRNSNHQQLLNSIKRASEQLKQDPQYGTPIPKALFMKSKMLVTNLWKVNLTGYWRMLYTISGNRVEIICYVLEICDHKKYDKILGYRKK
jgi:Txe/YoeB family toxin of Txe-Axe toxin-antitoxin module